MVAVIREDGRISVFWIFDNEPWTYWVGTYAEPEGYTDSYTWISKRTYTGNGLYASSLSEKEFHYEHDKISYQVSVQGQESTVTLVRGDCDTLDIPASAFGTSAGNSSSMFSGGNTPPVGLSNTVYEDLMVQDFSWWVSNGYLFYYFDLYNPNKGIAVEYPSYRLTARDENGVLLDTMEHTISTIYPGQNYIYSSQAFAVDGRPGDVQIDFFKPKSYDLKYEYNQDYYKPLQVVNSAFRSEKIVGEIYNPNSFDIETAMVIIAFKNSEGVVTDSVQTFVENVSAGESTPFSVMSFHNAKEGETTEISAQPW